MISPWDIIKPIEDTIKDLDAKGWLLIIGIGLIIIFIIGSIVGLATPNDKPGWFETYQFGKTKTEETVLPQGINISYDYGNKTNDTRWENITHQNTSVPILENISR